ncbi:MAG: hypothetical protein ACRDNL_20405, partial [Spirillospora sp.]
AALSADSLAAVLAAEAGAPPGDLCAQAVANALVGVHTALVGYVRRRVLADERVADLAADVRVEVNRALDVLEQGLSLPGGS